MRRLQLGLFEQGDDLPLMLATEPESPLECPPISVEIEPPPLYFIEEAHWSGRGRDGFAVVEVSGERKRKLGTFPTRHSAEWLLNRVQA